MIAGRRAHVLPGRPWATDLHRGVAGVSPATGRSSYSNENQNTGNLVTGGAGLRVSANSVDPRGLTPASATIDTPRVAICAMIRVL